jgi:hypothetical protein
VQKKKSKNPLDFLANLKYPKNIIFRLQIIVVWSFCTQNCRPNQTTIEQKNSYVIFERYTDEKVAKMATTININIKW